MEVISSNILDYTVATDYYPYHKTREILRETSWWWEHETRIKDPEKASNYLLNPDMVNSVEYSLQHRMHDGFFNFVYYKDELFLYSGFRIDKDNNAWLHRGATSPIIGKYHVGASSAILMPHQAKVAKEKGCKSYNLSFNEANYKFYVYYRDKHYYKSKLNVKGGETFMDGFDYYDNVFVMGQNQYVATLDFSKPNIDEILNA